MGYIEMRPLTPADELWVCDDCEQQGVKANGKVITDTQNEVVLWFCYNCVNKTLRG